MLPPIQLGNDLLSSLTMFDSYISYPCPSETSCLQPFIPNRHRWIKWSVWFIVTPQTPATNRSKTNGCDGINIIDTSSQSAKEEIKFTCHWIIFLHNSSYSSYSGCESGREGPTFPTGNGGVINQISLSLSASPRTNLIGQSIYICQGKYLKFIYSFPFVQISNIDLIFHYCSRLFLENKSCVRPAGYLAVSFPSFRSNLRCMFPVIRNSISAFPGHTFCLLQGIPINSAPIFPAPKF